MGPRRRHCCRPRWLSLVACSRLVGAGGHGDLATCADAEACKARLQFVTESLEAIGDWIGGKHVTLASLEQLRAGILESRRIEIDPVQRKHLQTASQLVSQVSYDARHRPIATNVSRHFKRSAIAALDFEVRLHAFVPLRPPDVVRGALEDSVIATIAHPSDLSLYNVAGEELLISFDLGHEADVAHFVSYVTLNGKEEVLLITGDSPGSVRVHSLQVSSTVPLRGDIAVVNFLCAFEAPDLTAVEAVEWNGQTFFLVGDADGNVGVFSSRGRLRRRIHITEDRGGIRGFARTLVGPTVVYSAHSFGHFNIAIADLEYPMCSGWSSPIAHAAVDINYSPSRVFVALEDGDVLVVNTARGRTKACDVATKFPRVSGLPFKLFPFAGFMMGMPMSDGPAGADAWTELFVFDLKAMDTGYGAAPPRTVYVQAVLSHDRPGGLSVWPGKPVPKIALRFVGGKGVVLYDVRLRSAPRSAVAKAEGMTERKAVGKWPWRSMLAVLCLGVGLTLAWMWWKRRLARKAAEPAADAQKEGEQEASAAHSGG